MGRKSKVFIANEGHHDYTSAEKFGGLVSLTKGRPNIFSTDNLFASIAEGLKDAEPEDYLLMSGNMVPNGMAMSCLLKKFGTVNALVWVNDGAKSGYRCIIIRDCNM